MTDVTNTDRDIDNLESKFKKKVEEWMKEVGSEVFITEGYRSQERQEYLYAQGRYDPYKNKTKVTWTLSSNHTPGKAVDVAFWGSELYPTDLSKWKKIAEIAKKYGIDWGFDLWGSDKPHFQCNNNPLPYKPMGYYEEIYNREKPDDYQPVFSEFIGDNPISEKEIKYLLEIRDFKKL